MYAPLHVKHMQAVSASLATSITKDMKTQHRDLLQKEVDYAKVQSRPLLDGNCLGHACVPYLASCALWCCSPPRLLWHSLEAACQ
jgi:hypothetical protein